MTPSPLGFELPSSVDIKELLHIEELELLGVDAWIMCNCVGLKPLRSIPADVCFSGFH